VRVNFELLSGARRGQVVQLEAERITIGRSPTNMLAFDPNVDMAVSSHHAEVTLGPNGRLEVTDLGSRNGTYVDGEAVTEPRAIGPGATIQFGHTGPMVRVIYRIEVPPPHAPPPGPYEHPRTPTADVHALPPMPAFASSPGEQEPFAPEGMTYIEPSHPQHAQQHQQPPPQAQPPPPPSPAFSYPPPFSQSYAPPPPLAAMLSQPGARNPSPPPAAWQAPDGTPWPAPTPTPSPTPYAGSAAGSLSASHAAPAPAPAHVPAPPAFERSTPVSAAPHAPEVKPISPIVPLPGAAPGFSTLAWALIGVSGAITAISIGVILAAVTGGGHVAPLPSVIAKVEALPPDPALPSPASGAGPALTAIGHSGAPRPQTRPVTPSQSERTASLIAAQQDLLRRAIEAADHAPAEAVASDPSQASPGGAGAPGARTDWKAAAEEERRRLDEASERLLARGTDDVVSLERRRSEALDAQKSRLVEAEKRMRDAEARRAQDLVLRRQEAAAARIERSSLERAQECLDRRAPALAYIVAESSITPAGADVAIPLARAEGNGYFVSATGLLRTTKRIALPWMFDLRGLGIAKRVLSAGSGEITTRYTVHVAGGGGASVALDPPGGVRLAYADPDELEDEFREVDIGARYGGIGREYVRPHLGASQGGNGAALLHLRGASGIRALPSASTSPAPGAVLLALGLVRAAPEAGSGAVMRLLTTWAPGVAGAEPGATEEDAARSGLPPGLEGAPLLAAAATEDVAVATLGGPTGKTGLAVIPSSAPPQTLDTLAGPAPKPVVCASRGHHLSPFASAQNCPLCPLPPPVRVDVPVEVAAEARGSYAIIESRVERRLRGTGYHELRAVVVLEALAPLGEAPFPGAVIVHELVKEGGLDWDELTSADVTVLAVGRERVARWPSPDVDHLRSLVAPGVKITIAIPDAHDRDGGFPVRRFVIAPTREVSRVAAGLRAKGLAR